MAKSRAEKIKISYHSVIIAVLILSAVYAVFVSGSSVFWRTVDGVKDLGTSLAYYAVNLVAADNNPIKATVIEIPENAVGLLPWTLEEFKATMGEFWQLFISPENIAAFFSSGTLLLYNVVIVVLLLMPFALLGILVIYLNGKNVNNDYARDTKPLTIFKRISARTYRPAKRWATGFISFLQKGGRKWYVVGAVVLWAYNLNLITIVLEVFAYIFYFEASFDILHLYTQVAKLFLDLQVFFQRVPTWIVVLMGIKIFDMLRIRAAKAGRKAREKVNAEFVKGLSIICLVIGTTGKKKTTMLADISLTKEVEFREQALSAIEKNSLKYPNFPWINFERTILYAEKKHAIYNWASCRRMIRLLKTVSTLKGERAVYRKDGIRYLRKKYGYKYKNLLFDYDVRVYGNTFDNSLFIEEIYGVLEAYAQEYYLYRFPSSLIMGNIPIRSRIKWKDEGNFPVMDSDFFDRKSKDVPQDSQYSHIIDYDAFRLGKLYKPNNPQSGAVEFGVVDFDEWAKDRGNQITNRGYETDDDYANPINDDFNLDMKTRRQSATVDNETYIFMIGTEQRADSMNADLLQLCDILDISDGFIFKIGIPFYDLEILLNELFSKLFSKFWQNEKLYHGNNTLLNYIITGIYGAWWRIYLKRLNEYGFFKGGFNRKLAGADGKIVNALYYLQFKKVYAKTFATDCFGSYYQMKADMCSVGLHDLPVYADIRQTIDEMSKQGSYYIEKLNATFGRGQRRDLNCYDWKEEKKSQQEKTISDQRKQIEKLSKEVEILRKGAKSVQDVKAKSTLPDKKLNAKNVGAGSTAE